MGRTPFIAMWVALALPMGCAEREIVSDLTATALTEEGAPFAGADVVACVYEMYYDLEAPYEAESPCFATRQTQADDAGQFSFERETDVTPVIIEGRVAATGYIVCGESDFGAYVRPEYEPDDPVPETIAVGDRIMDGIPSPDFSALLSKFDAACP